MKNYEALKQQGDVIWNIANLLRGPYRPPQYRRVMIPLTVLRRLDCVLEATKDDVIKYHKSLKAQGKPPERAGKVQLINGVEFARKMKKSLGDKRKRLGDGTDGSNDTPDGSPNHIATLTRLTA